MLCLFKKKRKTTHALGLFSDPGPVETKTALQTHCVLSLQSIWSSRDSNCCYNIHPQSTLLDATVGLVVSSFWWLQPVCFPKLLLGDCWGWDCAFFEWICRSWCYPTLLRAVHQTVRATRFQTALWTQCSLHRIDWPTVWTVAWAVCTALT